MMSVYCTDSRPRARWYQLRGLPLVGSECVCPQCNSSFVITRGSAKPSAFGLPVHLSRAHKKRKQKKWNSRHSKFSPLSNAQWYDHSGTRALLSFVSARIFLRRHDRLKCYWCFRSLYSRLGNKVPSTLCFVYVPVLYFKRRLPAGCGRGRRISRVIGGPYSSAGG